MVYTLRSNHGALIIKINRVIQILGEGPTLYLTESVRKVEEVMWWQRLRIEARI